MENKIIKNEYKLVITVPGNSVKAGSIGWQIPTGYEVLSAAIFNGSSHTLTEITAVSSGAFKVRNFSSSELSININAFVSFVKI